MLTSPSDTEKMQKLADSLWSQPFMRNNSVVIRRAAHRLSNLEIRIKACYTEIRNKDAIILKLMESKDAIRT